MQQDLIPKIDKAKFAIEILFKQAYEHTHLDGRFSPHRNFTRSLEEWCDKNNMDFRKWNESMFRLFSLRAKFPNSKPAKIVNYVIDRDKEKLQLI